MWCARIPTGLCVTRIWTIDEDEAADLLIEIQKQLKKRQWGEVIRLEVEDKIDKRLLKILKTEFNIKDDESVLYSRPPGPDLPHENVRTGGIRGI